MRDSAITEYPGRKWLRLFLSSGKVNPPVSKYTPSPSTGAAMRGPLRLTYFNRLRASRAPSTMVFSFALATGSDSGTSPQSGAA